MTETIDEEFDEDEVVEEEGLQVTRALRPREEKRILTEILERWAGKTLQQVLDEWESGVYSHLAPEILDIYSSALLKLHAREQDPDSGKPRGIRGPNRILFSEHYMAQRRREIYPTEGVPDPNIVAGIFNREHPGGRKVNSPEARRRGASYYKN